MTLVAAIAGLIAALTGIATVVMMKVDSRRRRLVEIVDMLTEIEAAVEWGSTGSLRRDAVQGQLRTRLGALPLPATQRLAAARLTSEESSQVLVSEALAEARSALDRGRLRQLAQ